MEALDRGSGRGWGKGRMSAMQGVLYSAVRTAAVAGSKVGPGATHKVHSPVGLAA